MFELSNKLLLSLNSDVRLVTVQIDLILVEVQAEGLLVALRIVILQVSSLVVRLQKVVRLEAFLADHTFENMRLADWLLKHILISIQSATFHFQLVF